MLIDVINVQSSLFNPINIFLLLRPLVIPVNKDNLLNLASV